MNKKLISFLLLFLVFLAGCSGAALQGTASPSAVITFTATAQPTPTTGATGSTQTPTTPMQPPTPAITPTQAPTPSPTPAASQGASPTPRITSTPRVTATPKATVTPTPTPAVTPTPAPTPVKDDFNAVLRFAVMTDLHFYYSFIPSRFASVMKSVYDFAGKNGNYKELDALLIAGDLTQDAIAGTISAYKKGIRDNVRQGTQVIACMGNHEFMKDTTQYSSTGKIVYYTQEEAVNLFKEATNQEPNTHTVIKGIHFIAWSPTISGSAISYDANIAWLEEQLKIAAQDDPTKPIFVMQHYPVRGTTYGYGSSKLTHYSLNQAKELFEEYPQVINFTGHTHHAPSFATALHQDKYTSLTSGSLMDYQFPEQDQYITNVKNATGNKCLIVEVNAKNEVRIYVYDTSQNQPYFDEPYIIEKPSDPDTFKYTNEKRKSQSSAPVFPANTALKVSGIASSQANITFNRASCSSKPQINDVYYYQLDIFQNGKRIKRLYLSAHTYSKVDVNSPYTYTITGLTSNTEYTIKLCAVDAYYRQSETLQASFKTL